jgi:hypothetical protein
MSVGEQSSDSQGQHLEDSVDGLAEFDSRRPIMESPAKTGLSRSSKESARTGLDVAGRTRDSGAGALPVGDSSSEQPRRSPLEARS